MPSIGEGDGLGGTVEDDVVAGDAIADGVSVGLEAGESVGVDDGVVAGDAHATSNPQSKRATTRFTSIETVRRPRQLRANDCRACGATRWHQRYIFAIPATQPNVIIDFSMPCRPGPAGRAPAWW